MNHKLTTYCLLLTAFLIFPLMASADLPPPRIIDLNTICCDADSWMVDIGNFLLAAGMVLAVMVIVLSGIKWVTAGADPKAAGEARSILMSGIWGVGIILGVGLIIKTIASIVSGDFFN